MALPEITQLFTVDVAPRGAGLELAIGRANDFRDANLENVVALGDLSRSMAANAVAADAAAGQLNDLSDAAIRASLGADDLDGTLVDVRDSAAAASAAAGGLSRSFTGLA